MHVLVLWLLPVVVISLVCVDVGHSNVYNACISWHSLCNLAVSTFASSARVTYAVQYILYVYTSYMLQVAVCACAQQFTSMHSL